MRRGLNDDRGLLRAPSVASLNRSTTKRILTPVYILLLQGEHHCTGVPSMTSEPFVLDLPEELEAAVSLTRPELEQHIRLMAALKMF